MIALLVPVLGRPRQVTDVYKSIEHATTLEHRVVFICSPGDEEAERAARDTGADVHLASWLPGRADYAKKLALGFEATSEEWLFQGATDLAFYEGWDTSAMQVAKQSRARVIGTNDLGNPLVKRGQHSTHTLFHRSYITDLGGVIDGTGLIFSEMYDHQWTDTEFIETAKLRREFAFARRSVVEHMHPHWNKGDMDTTYEKATRETTRDQQLFMRRRSIVVRGVTEQKRHKKVPQ